MTRSRVTTVLAAVLCAAAGAASGAFDAASGLLPLDLALLGRAADTLLSSRWADSFASPEVQVGPLHLALLGLLRAAARTLGSSHRMVLAMTVGAGASVGVFGLVRFFLERRRPLLQAGAGLAVVLGGTAWTAYISGHPEELAIGLLWICAGVAAARGNGSWAGASLAAAAALKASGVLGLPLLLLAPTARARLNGVATLVAGCALAYLPFFVWGDVRTFEYSWGVRSDLWAALIGSSFPWWMRIVQGTAVVMLGGVVVQGMSRRPGAAWIAPLVLVTLRVMLDPHPQHYFWLPFEAASIVGAAVIVATAPLVRGTVAAAAAYGGLLARYLAIYPGWAVRGAVGAVLVWLAGPGITRLDPAPSGALGAGGKEPVAGPDGTIEPLKR